LAIKKGGLKRVKNPFIFGGACTAARRASQTYFGWNQLSGIDSLDEHVLFLRTSKEDKGKFLKEISAVPSKFCSNINHALTPTSFKNSEPMLRFKKLYVIFEY